MSNSKVKILPRKKSEPLYKVDIESTSGVKNFTHSRRATGMVFHYQKILSLLDPNVKLYLYKEFTHQELHYDVHKKSFTLLAPHEFCDENNHNSTKRVEEYEDAMKDWLGDMGDHYGYGLFMLIIDYQNEAHANVLAMDFQAQKVYRYDPHGAIANTHDKFNVEHHLRLYFIKLGFDYNGLNVTMPLEGPQQSDEELDKIENGGYCASWCLWLIFAILNEQCKQDRDCDWFSTKYIPCCKDLIAKRMKKIESHACGLYPVYVTFIQGFIMQLCTMNGKKFFDGVTFDYKSAFIQTELAYLPQPLLSYIGNDSLDIVPCHNSANAVSFRCIESDPRFVIMVFRNIYFQIYIGGSGNRFRWVQNLKVLEMLLIMSTTDGDFQNPLEGDWRDFCYDDFQYSRSYGDYGYEAGEAKEAFISYLLGDTLSLYLYKEWLKMTSEDVFYSSDDKLNSILVEIFDMCDRRSVDFEKVFIFPQIIRGSFENGLNAFGTYISQAKLPQEARVLNIFESCRILESGRPDTASLTSVEISVQVRGFTYKVNKDKLRNLFDTLSTNSRRALQAKIVSVFLSDHYNYKYMKEFSYYDSSLSRYDHMDRITNHRQLNHFIEKECLPIRDTDVFYDTVAIDDSVDRLPIRDTDVFYDTNSVIDRKGKKKIN